MYSLIGFQRDCLYVIAGLDESSGLQIKDELNEYYEKEITSGRLYPNLDRLVEKGLIEKDHLDQRTNLYTVTQRGRHEFEEHHEWRTQYVDQ